MNGARWVQQEVLDKQPKADLAVYAIWFSMYPTDAREHWPGDVLTDPRVVHVWDEGKTVGRWYMSRVADIESARAPGSGGLGGNVLWDAFLVYGPEAHWRDAPDGLRRWGRTILGTQDALREAVATVVPPADASR